VIDTSLYAIGHIWSLVIVFSSFNGARRPS